MRVIGCRAHMLPLLTHVIYSTPKAVLAEPDALACIVTAAAFVSTEYPCSYCAAYSYCNMWKHLAARDTCTTTFICGLHDCRTRVTPGSASPRNPMMWIWEPLSGTSTRQILPHDGVESPTWQYVCSSLCILACNSAHMCSSTWQPDRQPRCEPAAMCRS